MIRSQDHSYKLLGSIGEGAYARVYKAIRVENDSSAYTAKRSNVSEGPDNTRQRLYAIKIIANDAPSRYRVRRAPRSKARSRGVALAKAATSARHLGQVSPKRENLFTIPNLREIKILKELRGHPNVVKLVDVVTNKDLLAIVLEWLERDMRQIIDFHRKCSRPISLYCIKSMSWQAIKALRYLHENWVIHRDVKPQNILIGEDGSVKLGDFNCARFFRNPVKPMGIVDKTVVTLWYRAPELLLGAIEYTTAIDVWSMACVLAELFLAGVSDRKALFPGTPAQSGFEAGQADEIFRILGFPTLRLLTCRVCHI